MSTGERCAEATTSDVEDGLAEVLAFPSNTRRGRESSTSVELAEPRLRRVIGAVLRDERERQERVLADVASSAAVSLPYLSEVERGRKEVSSDLLAAVTDALDLSLFEVLERCVERLRPGSQSDSGIQLRAA